MKTGKLFFSKINFYIFARKKIKLTNMKHLISFYKSHKSHNKYLIINLLLPTISFVFLLSENEN